MAFKLNNPFNNTDNLTKEQLRDRRIAARKALEAEQKRVKNIRSKIDEVAENALKGQYTINYGVNDARAGVEGAGIVPQKTYEWLRSTNGAGCSTYACSIMREAGVTVPNSVGPEGITINNVTYKPGDKMPIIPGNEQFDALAPKLGFELRPPGSLPEEGDVTRVNYGYGRTSHSTIQTGDGRNVYNPGWLPSGLKQNKIWAQPQDFEGMTKEETQAYIRELEEQGQMRRAKKAKLDDGRIYKNRLMQYVGDLPNLQKQFEEAAQALGPEEPIMQYKQKLKPATLGPTTPTAQLPTNMLTFFNRNKK